MSDLTQTKRLRIFAGPNGSGKTSLIKEIQSKQIRLGYYVNADDIEKELKEKGANNLSEYPFISSTEEWHQFIANSGFATKGKIDFSTITDDTVIKNGVKIVSKSILSGKNISPYLSALIADFIREKLLERGEPFSFETVFSDPSKVSFMERAQKAGYKVYLYFICTSDPEINVFRVKGRVTLGGHEVKETKIRKRYFRSLEQISKAWQYAYRAYFFDNSDTSAISNSLIAEITPGKKVILTDHKNVPDWFNKYFISRIKK